MIQAPDIPGHTVGGVLGSGGFATVYRTWQIAVGRETAVKVDSRVLHTERDQRRFVREVTAAGRLSGHPHVIDVYDAGTLRDGRPYLVMELCPDGSLGDRLHRNGPMSAEMACRIGINLADALAAAHDVGILHRDIKPANILINRYGVVGLSDFGLASIIATSGEQSVSREALTPAYAPPESFEAAEPTAAADIYSLAATLYALMAGRPPRFPDDTSSLGLATILAMHSQPVQDIPGVPARMLALLRQCLAVDPAQRLPSAAALRDELAALLGRPARGPGHAPPPPRDPGQAAPPPGGQHVSSARSVPLSETAAIAESRPSAAYTTPAQAWPSTESPAVRGARTTEAGQGDRAVGQRRRAAGRGRRMDGQGARAADRVRRGRPMALAAVVAGCLVLVTIGAFVVAPRLHGPAGTGPSGVVNTFGIATTTSHCPAAIVQGAGARCPSQPECWNGLNEDEGVMTARSLPCKRAHTWQTFAIGIMPTDASTFNVNVVQANPIVRAVCSAKVLLRSRMPAARLIPRRRWSIQVLPPDEAGYDSGIRTYRCLATLGYADSKASQFRP